MIIGVFSVYADDLIKEDIDYTELTKQLKMFEKEYSDILSVYSIGKSCDNRDLWVAKLGKSNIGIIIIGAIHARERITAKVLLQNIKDYCKAYKEGVSFEGYNLKELLDKASIYFIPMTNPDGVDYTFYGKKAVRDKNLLKNLKNIRVKKDPSWKSNIMDWKANIRGIDLNRQWNVLWGIPSRFIRRRPSNDHFQGFKPHSEPEVKALEQFTLNTPCLGYYAYHTQGSVLFWYKNQKGIYLDEVYDITRGLKNITGFKPIPKLSKSLRYWDTRMGYADWTAYKLKKPSITLELAWNGYDEKRDFKKIYLSVKKVPLYLLKKAIDYSKFYNVEVYKEDKLVQLFRDLNDAKIYIEKFIKDKFDREVKVFENGALVLTLNEKKQNLKVNLNIVKEKINKIEDDMNVLIMKPEDFAKIKHQIMVIKILFSFGKM
ncbi:M14 family zinc carboxypeptidase [Caminicella sporogenes]|nr:M14 family zinc carboxypeptidase [Caminicella sporogenes]RKD22403.1 hypothetical protein BET04_05050 [Caminicella sporogenes]